MPHQLTFTGPLGPGLSRTALVFLDVQRLDWDLPRKVLQVFQPNEKVTDLDLTATTTVTDTITAGNHAWVVSQ